MDIRGKKGAGGGEREQSDKAGEQQRGVGRGGGVVEVVEGAEERLNGLGALLNRGTQGEADVLGELLVMGEMSLLGWGGKSTCSSRSRPCAAAARLVSL